MVVDHHQVEVVLQSVMEVLLYNLLVVVVVVLDAVAVVLEKMETLEAVVGMAQYLFGLGSHARSG